MEALPDFLVDEEHALMIWRPRAVINENAVERIVAAIDRVEARTETPYNRFTDTVAADMVDLNFQFIFRISLYRRLAYTGPPVKSAVLVNSLAIAQYWKLHAMLTQSSPLEVRIFRERGEAAAWLNVAVHTLE